MNHTVKRTTAAILAALILAGTTAAAATFAAPTIAHATEGAGTGTVKDSHGNSQMTAPSPFPAVEPWKDTL